MANLFPEQYDDQGASSGAVGLVRAWGEGLGASSEAESPADAQTHRERVANDELVVATLEREGLKGPAWEEFTEALVAYAYQCLLGWIRSGLIVLRCRERGIPLPTGFMVTLREGDAEQLTEEILADAVLGFQELLRQGRWSLEGGASLATFFVGQCITRFPNLYRVWLRDRRPTSWVPISELDESSARVAYARQIDPADAAIAAVELQRVSDELDERTLHAVVLQELGYQVVEIAELLGESPKAIEMVLYHHRRRMREKGGTA
jgi:DNA-directed RNA polymerase specialized sigma24 family protein